MNNAEITSEVILEFFTWTSPSLAIAVGDHSAHTLFQILADRALKAETTEKCDICVTLWFLKPRINISGFSICSKLP